MAKNLPSLCVQSHLYLLGQDSTGKKGGAAASISRRSSVPVTPPSSPRRGSATPLPSARRDSAPVTPPASPGKGRICTMPPTGSRRGSVPVTPTATPPSSPRRGRVLAAFPSGPRRDSVPAMPLHPAPGFNRRHTTCQALTILPPPGSAPGPASPLARSSLTLPSRMVGGAKNLRSATSTQSLANRSLEGVVCPPRPLSLPPTSLTEAVLSVAHEIGASESLEELVADARRLHQTLWRISMEFDLESVAPEPRPSSQDFTDLRPAARDFTDSRPASRDFTGSGPPTRSISEPSPSLLDFAEPRSATLPRPSPPPHVVTPPRVSSPLYTATLPRPNSSSRLSAPLNTCTPPRSNTPLNSSTLPRTSTSSRPNVPLNTPTSSNPNTPLNTYVPPRSSTPLNGSTLPRTNASSHPNTPLNTLTSSNANTPLNTYVPPCSNTPLNGSTLPRTNASSRPNIPLNTSTSSRSNTPLNSSTLPHTNASSRPNTPLNTPTSSNASTPLNTSTSSRSNTPLNSSTLPRTNASSRPNTPLNTSTSSRSNTPLNGSTLPRTNASSRPNTPLNTSTLSHSNTSSRRNTPLNTPTSSRPSTPLNTDTLPLPNTASHPGTPLHSPTHSHPSSPLLTSTPAPLHTSTPSPLRTSTPTSLHTSAPPRTSTPLNGLPLSITQPPPPPSESVGVRPTVADFMDELSEVEHRVTGPTSPNTEAENSRSNITASKATKELDELMANLSNFEPPPSTDPVVSDYSRDYAKLGAKGGAGAVADLNSMLGSLSQDMAVRHGVDTASKGICSACSKPILAKVVNALGRQWHPEHFTCASCDEELGATTYYESNGRPYCEKDYHELFAPRCAFCNGPILERVMRALERTWHPEHFFCTLCGKHFGPEGFHEKDGKAFCRECYYEKFAPRCKRCEKAIMEGYVTALTAQWHPECFSCKVCAVTFPRGNYYEHEGEPHCEIHYHASRGTLCASCQKPVTGKCITAMGKKWHPEHFTCAFCLKLLNKGTFKEHRSNPYCQPCYIKLFG